MLNRAREYAPGFALAALTIAAGHHLGAATLGAVALNLGATVLAPHFDRASKYFCRRLLSEDGLANHDLERAVQRAFASAIDHVEACWWQEWPGAEIKRQGGDRYERARNFFRTIRMDSQRLPHLRPPINSPDAARFIELADADILASLMEHLRPYLGYYEPELLDFIRERLPQAVALAFGEYLKGDKPEHDRAWRGYQKLMVGGLQDTAANIEVLLGTARIEQAEMAETLTRLDAWREKLEKSPVHERDATGDAALSETLIGLETRIAQTIRAAAEEARIELSNLREDVGLTFDAVVETRNEIAQTRELLATLRLKDTAERHGLQRLPGALPSVWNIPHSRNPHFASRDAELAMLAEALAAEPGAAAIHAVHGLGGVGKTQVAIEYAYRHAVDRDDYALVWWVRAENRDILSADYAGLAGELNLQRSDDLDQDSSIEAARDWLERAVQPWLLVFDNAVAHEDLRAFLPRGGAGKVIITSRNPAWLAIAKPIALQVPPLEDAAAFLRTRTGRNESAAEDLAEALGRLPLAMEQAAAYIVANQVPIARYLELFRERKIQLLELLQRSKPDTDYPWTVATVWEMAFRQLEASEPQASDLMALCAFIDPEAIPLDLLAASSEALPNQLREALSDKLVASETLGLLHRYSLVEVVDEHAFNVHRLVQEVVRYGMGEDSQRLWAASAVEVLHAAIPCSGGEPADWKWIERLIPHCLAAVQHAINLRVSRTTTAWLLRDMGDYFRDRVRLKEARVVLEQSLAIMEQETGPESSEVADVIQSLAGVFQDLNDLDSARRLIERALEIESGRCGTESQDYAALLNDYAANLRYQGHMDKALKLFRKSLTIIEADPCPNQIAIAVRLSNIAQILDLQGDDAEAKRLFLRSLEILESEVGPVNHDIAIVLRQLVGLADDLEEARRLAERALSIDIELYGSGHPHIAISMNKMAQIHNDMREYTRALLLWQEALAINEEYYGPESPQVADVSFNLATAYVNLDDHGNARRCVERSLNIRKLHVDHADNSIINCYTNLAFIYNHEGDLSSAKDTLIQAAELARDNRYPHRAGLILMNLAELEEEHRQFRSAAERLRQALRELWTLPPSYEEADCFSRLDGLADSLGQRKKGRKLLAACYVIELMTKDPEARETIDLLQQSFSWIELLQNRLPSLIAEVRAQYRLDRGRSLVDSFVDSL